MLFLAVGELERSAITLRQSRRTGWSGTALSGETNADIDDVSRVERTWSVIMSRVFSRWMRLCFIFVILFTLFGVGLRVSLVWFEEKLIYFPSTELATTPEAVGLTHERIDLRSSDGVRVSAWYLPVRLPSENRRAVLFCHGNAGNIADRLPRVAELHGQLGVDVLLFDYRGYGASDGTPSEEGTYRDGRAAYDYLRETKGVPPERIVLYGESLGAGVAVQLATEVGARALVLEAPFTSIPDMAAEVYPWLPFRRWIRTQYDNLTKIVSIEIPLLIIHGTRDPTVPFAHGERLFRAASDPKRFLAVNGAGHTDSSLVASEDYWDAWRDLLSVSATETEGASPLSRP
jgi:fermentation-respiration switch protein FrsA (DUF1100 family)